LREHAQVGVKCNPAKSHHGAHTAEQAKLFLKERTAISKLDRERFVSGRSAPKRSCDVTVVEPKSVATMKRLGLVRESCFVEGAV
jgi:hypothetical protein